MCHALMKAATLTIPLSKIYDGEIRSVSSTGTAKLPLHLLSKSSQVHAPDSQITGPLLAMRTFSHASL